MINAVAIFIPNESPDLQELNDYLKKGYYPTRQFELSNGLVLFLDKESDSE